MTATPSGSTRSRYHLLSWNMRAAGRAGAGRLDRLEVVDGPASRAAAHRARRPAVAVEHHFGVGVARGAVGLHRLEAVERDAVADDAAHHRAGPVGSERTHVAGALGADLEADDLRI